MRNYKIRAYENREVRERAIVSKGFGPQRTALLDRSRGVDNADIILSIQQRRERRAARRGEGEGKGEEVEGAGAEE